MLPVQIEQILLYIIYRVFQRTIAFSIIFCNDSLSTLEVNPSLVGHDGLGHPMYIPCLPAQHPVSLSSEVAMHRQDNDEEACPAPVQLNNSERKDQLVL